MSEVLSSAGNFISEILNQLFRSLTWQVVTALAVSYVFYRHEISNQAGKKNKQREAEKLRNTKAYWLPSTAFSMNKEDDYDE